MTLPVAEVDFVEASWILVVKSIVIFAVIFAIVPMLTVIERKLLGRFQARYGPNRVGPFGLLQPLADAVKLVTKEHYRPENAIPILWPIAPAIVVFFIWVRATIPRLRYDQLMSLGWKVLLPLATLNLLVTATLVALT